MEFPNFEAEDDVSVRIVLHCVTSHLTDHELKQIRDFLFSGIKESKGKESWLMK